MDISNEILGLYALLGLITSGIGYVILLLREMRSDVDCTHETMHEFYEETLPEIYTLMALSLSDKELSDLMSEGHNISDSENSSIIADWDAGVTSKIINNAFSKDCKDDCDCDCDCGHDSEE